MPTTIDHAAIGAFVDTGQWRLILHISPTGMTGLLKNSMQPQQPLMPIFHRTWDSDSNLLTEVETTVYDNPRMLDDFATQIVVTTPKTMWIPSDLTEYEEFDENFFTAVYDGKPSDIFADFGDEEVCLYWVGEGLNPFLSRTLPGCRISCSLTLLKDHYMKSAGEGKRIYVDLRDREMDIFIFDSGKMLSGASHPLDDGAGLSDYLLLAEDAFGIPLTDFKLHLYGERSKLEVAKENVAHLVADIECEEQDVGLIEAGICHAMAIAAGK